MTRDPDPITRLYRACEPNEALRPDDPRYVNCDDVRGENLAGLFERSLRTADPTRPKFKLFAGHRGVGKTSELLRLKQMLEQPRQTSERPFLVIFFDVSESLDINDLDFPDLLICIAGQVQSQLQDARIPGFTAVTTLLRNVWDGLRQLCGAKVEVKEADIDLGFGSLALEIRNRPNARQQLREGIELQSTRLLDAVNDLLLDANTKLRASGREGLVLIIDGLDKVIRRDLGGGINTHDRLFIHRSSQMTSLHAHTVYTVPISLCYSPLCQQLEQCFGEFNVPLPMIRLHEKREGKIAPDTPGMKKMREILGKRCEKASVKLADVFDSRETGNYLCEMSGGHPRHLMMFVQAAANAVDALPITREAAEKAVRNYANSLLREVPDPFWRKLRKFDKPQSNIPKDDDHQQMLLLLHVFEYMNAKSWYEVNPVFRTLSRYGGRRSRSPR
jgi:hypothetical protein